MELFWFNDDSHLAQFDMMAESNFFPRFNRLETGASPFGFGLYPRISDANLFTSQIESRTTNETQISKQHLQFSLGSLANDGEPICYVVPDYVANSLRLDRVWEIDHQSRTQSLGMRQLTRVKLKVSSDRIFTTPLLTVV